MKEQYRYLGTSARTDEEAIIRPVSYTHLDVYKRQGYVRMIFFSTRKRESAKKLLKIKDRRYARFPT